LTKSQVRKIAEENDLVTAKKKESMGICFVGKVGIKEFLTEYLHHNLNPPHADCVECLEDGPLHSGVECLRVGNIIDQNGVVVGEHDGAIFYTIGQRHGLDVGGGLPYYVTGKDMKKNEVYVTNNIDDPKLWSSEIQLTSVHWIAADGRESIFKNREELQVRTRHRAKLIACTMTQRPNGDVLLKLAEQVRALTPGQSAVLYSGDVCLGGGIIY
jgi:tRNA-specific 2-thiouridylase